VFVESIIAAAIVAMALGATFRVVADSANRQRDVELQRNALLIAQSELAAVGSEIPLQTGQSAGLAGDLVWRVDVSPYADGLESDTVGDLWRVHVSVQPRAGGLELAKLDTLLIGPKA
jgi:type II secretory pathway pseudopilin PulG